jgi:hypothetical protein
MQPPNWLSFLQASRMDLDCASLIMNCVHLVVAVDIMVWVSVQEASVGFTVEGFIEVVVGSGLFIVGASVTEG